MCTRSHWFIIVTCQIVKLTSNKQTEVAFSLNILVLKGLVKTNVNLSFLDILMGQLHECTQDTAMITGEVSH